MAEDPDQIVAEIRALQGRITEAQHAVIQGCMKPDEYNATYRTCLAEIHAREERLKRLMGM